MQWRSAMEIIGLGGFCLAAVFWVFVRDQSPDHIRQRHIAPPATSFGSSVKTIFTDAQSWWLSLYSGLAFAPVMVFGGLWGVSFLSQAFSLSKNLSAQMVSLIFIGFAIGAPIFGWFSDWLGRRRIVMFWGTLVSLFSISLVIYAPSPAFYHLALLLFLFGFSISSFLLCFTMICEIHTPLLAATAIGFMNAFDALLGAISDPLTGKFLDSVWDGTLIEGARVFSVSAYKIAFATLPIYLALSLFALFKIKETQPKPPRPASLP
jgi:MFS family permease